MKVYINKVGENWVVDRFRKEFYKYNNNLTTNFISRSDLVWIIAPWVWKKIPKKYLSKKKVICTYHHLDLKNFDENKQFDFDELNHYVDEYHSVSQATKLQLQKFTNKKITTIPFWINQNLFFHIKDKSNLKIELGFNVDDYLIGSFQRDTEGKDLISPKLIKGPDIFLRIVKDLYHKNNKIKVVLTGKRRQYIISNLEKLNIPYVYFEMVDFKFLNKLYNALDLYIVSSRVEGGPQAILESAITKTPIISTNVGIAPDILHKSSIYDENGEIGIPNIDFAFNNSKKFIIPKGFLEFRKLLDDIYKN